MYRNRLSDEIISAVMENVKEAIEEGKIDIPVETQKTDERFDLLLQAKEFANSIYKNREKEPFDSVTEKLLWAIENLILVVGMTISKEDGGLSVEKPRVPVNVPGAKEEDITDEVLAGVPKNER